MSAPACGHDTKSNAQLTPSELECKKRLKSELKFQRRVKKLETRIKHAISRNDPVVEQSAREELVALLSTKNNEGSTDDQQVCDLFSPSKTEPEGQAALDEVLLIFRRLLSSIDDDDKKQMSITKVQQTEKARNLLGNMTKGTQSKSMFQDITALRGYTRQKFYGRAALIIESMAKLSPTSMEQASSLQSSRDSQEHMHQKELDMCWEKFGNVENACSLGCGPGNDAVGLIALLRTYFGKDCINNICMLDYAINEWKDAVLNNLIPILVPEYVENITCGSCDVTNSIDDDGIKQMVEESDIFLTSYLLTETRNQWDKFFIELVGLAKVGALFYFAEPVPWQLHRLIQLSKVEDDISPLHCLRFVWIDSSMHFPEMQPLDRRSGGPAVLVAIKLS